jgi:tetratricopeptide (TPR) repeat protein
MKPLVLVLLIPILAGTADLSPEALQEAGHWKQLRRIAEARVTANPKDSRSLYLLSCARLAFGDVDDALKLAEQAVALEPDNSKYHLQLALAYGNKANRSSFFSAMRLGGRYKAEVQKAVDLDTKNVDARWELMEFHIHAPSIAGGDRQKARALAQEILGSNPAQGFMALAEIAEANKQPEETESNLRKAAAADPTSYAAQMGAAWFYASEERKNYDQAEKYARDGLALDPSRSSSYTVLARVFVRKERWQELDSILEQAEKNVPDDLNPEFQAGLELLAAEKDPNRAERYFRKYLAQEPEGRTPALSRAHWRLGQALDRQGRKREAIAEIETALRLEPSLDQAKKDLKEIRSRT